MPRDFLGRTVRLLVVCARKIVVDLDIIPLQLVVSLALVASEPSRLRCILLAALLLARCRLIVRGFCLATLETLVAFVLVSILISGRAVLLPL